MSNFWGAVHSEVFNFLLEGDNLHNLHLLQKNIEEKLILYL